MLHATYMYITSEYLIAYAYFLSFVKQIKHYQQDKVWTLTKLLGIVDHDLELICLSEVIIHVYTNQ